MAKDMAGVRSNTVVKYIVAVLVLVLTSCEEPAVEIEDHSEPLYFETIGRGHTGVGRDTLEVVVRDADSWARVSASIRPLAPFESVDFSQAMVALIALPTESGGYTIEVETVESLDGLITVSYLVNEPGTDCITPTALALPFQAVFFKREDGEVRFVRRTVAYSCEL